MRRIVSCFTNCYGPLGVHAAVDAIRGAGIHHLEIPLKGHDFGGLVIPEAVVVTERADDATAAAFVDHLHRAGVAISGCNVGGADLLTGEGVELVQRRIAFGRRWFGVSVVIADAGQPQTPEERRTILASLRRIGDFAAEAGVVVALETHAGPTQNAAAMLQLMDDLDHPALRLNFDTGNIGYYNVGLDPAVELEQVKHLVKNVHIKDNRGRPKDWYFPALGDGGAVDFRQIREILDRVGYLGAYTIEIEGIGGEPEPGLDGRQDRIKRSVEHLEKMGYFD